MALAKPSMSNRKHYSHLSSVVLPVIFGISFFLFSSTRAHGMSNIDRDKSRAVQYSVRDHQPVKVGHNGEPVVYDKNNMTRTNQTIEPKKILRSKELAGIPRKIQDFRKIKMHSNIKHTLGKVSKEENERLSTNIGQLHIEKISSKSDFQTNDVLLGKGPRQNTLTKRSTRSSRRSRIGKIDHKQRQHTENFETRLALQETEKEQGLPSLVKPFNQKIRNVKMRKHGKGAVAGHKRRLTISKSPVAAVGESVSGNTDGTGPSCPGCQTMEMYQEKIQAIETARFKVLLLEKLRMSEEDLRHPPLTNGFPKLPQDVWEEFANKSTRVENKRFYAQEEEVIIKGEDLLEKCLPSRQVTGCYRFALKKMIHGKVASAQLWFFKKPDGNDVNGQIVRVFQSGQPRRGRRQCGTLDVRQTVSTQQGWIAVNITSSVKCWSDALMRSVKIAIRCETCWSWDHEALYGAQSGYKPLLILKYDPEVSSGREKRSSAACDPRFECCKIDYNITFANVGMPQIAVPQSLNVGYCFGPCNIPVNTSQSYLSLRLAALNHDTSLPESIRNQLKPCCVPHLKRGHSFMILQRGGVNNQYVPDAIVDTCRCE